MPKEAPVKVDNCKVVAVGRHAILVENDEWDEPLWIPDTQIDDDSELYMQSKKGDEGTLVISAWIAKQKGIT